MQVFYYYYYIFYKKILDPDPRVAAVLGMTALTGFFFIAVLNIALAYLFCFDFSKWYMLAVFAICLIVNNFYFFTSENVKAIVKAKPMFFHNHRLTVAIVLVFSLVVISSLFWAGDYTNHILARCR